VNDLRTLPGSAYRAMGFRIERMTNSSTDPSAAPANNSAKRVVITGATGLIGTALVEALTKAGHPVTRLVRKNASGTDKMWDPAAGTIDASAIEGAWAVVHLAGEGIGDAKWSPEHKARVLDSRVKGTTLIAKTIAEATQKPAVFACGSAIGFYADRGDQLLDETASLGTGFLAEVVSKWEACAKAAIDAGVRTAFLRTGVVLSTKGGALKQQLLPFKLGAGGKIGPGTQYLPWITITDEVRAIMHVLTTESISGPVNLVSPNPVTNGVFTKALGKAVHRPTLIPTPLIAIKILYGEEMLREMLLASTRLDPAVLRSTGFRFEHPSIDDALRQVLSAKL
jgi:uncharacterized protein